MTFEEEVEKYLERAREYNRMAMLSGGLHEASSTAGEILACEHLLRIHATSCKRMKHPLSELERKELPELERLLLFVTPIYQNYVGVSAFDELFDDFMDHLRARAKELAAKRDGENEE